MKLFVEKINNENKIVKSSVKFSCMIYFILFLLLCPYSFSMNQDKGYFMNHMFDNSY